MIRGTKAQIKDDNRLRPLVLILVRHYLPSFRHGGPVRSIANLVEACSIDFDIRIICLNRDAGENPLFDRVVSDQWLPVGKAMVKYLPVNLKLPTKIVRETAQLAPDCVYLNSFFDPIFSLLPSLHFWIHRQKRYGLLIAPRGEFGGAALSISSRKKRAFLALFRLVGVYTETVFQATSDQEVQQIQRELEVGRAQVVVLPNTLKAPNSEISDSRSRRGRARIVYLSRISPIKNLDFAIEVLKTTKGDVDFDIYGPIDDSVYWQRCKNLISGLPVEIKATYRGSVFPDDVGKILSEYDLFLLPTKGENHGHAILEAFQSGVPVVISDKTPWRQLRKHGVGWDVTLTSRGRFSEVIQEFIDMSAEEKLNMGRDALGFANEIYNASAPCGQLRNALQVARTLCGLPINTYDNEIRSK